jgi:hypothetical protein
LKGLHELSDAALRGGDHVVAVIGDVPVASTGCLPAGLGLVAAPDDRTRLQEFHMTDKPKILSDTARMLLTAAAMRGDHLVRPPQLPIAAARQVVRSLLNARLAEVALASIGPQTLFGVLATTAKSWCCE